MRTTAAASSRTSNRMSMSVEEKVNQMEGEDYTSDLEITRSVRKDLVDLSQYIEGREAPALSLRSGPRQANPQSMLVDVAGSESQSSQTENSDTTTRKRSPRKRRRSAHESGERVEWSSDDDAEAAYTAFKNRRAAQRKRIAAEVKQAKAKVTASCAKSIVGKKARREPALIGKKPALKKWDTYNGEDSEDENKLMDETLPDYIKDRKTKFEKARERLGEAGLKLAPTYDDIYFSDDERMEYLKEKPVLNLRPPAPYKDVTMPCSAGIIPAPIAQWLRDYQVKGAEFLHELFVWQRGGILGDDMGLGKTIQVIAFLTAAFGKTGDERDAKRMRKVRRMNDGCWYPKVLIICPGGLMQNWRDELERWGWWQVYVYHGAPDVKEATLQAASKGRAEIVITTYTTYRINKSAINMVDWDCVIADECHTMKGRNSETSQAMNDINALCRIGLTGTAIQNNYEELYTLLNWTNPGRFGSLSSWKHCISEPLRMGQAHDATVAQLAKARKTADSLVNHLLPQFFLRRMKTLIADQLPKKSDRVVFCQLTDTQAEAYEDYIDSDIVEYIRLSADLCPCASGKKRGWCCYMEIPGRGKWQHHVFPSIVTLQKLSNHLALLIPSGIDSADKQAKDLENLQVALPNQWKGLYRNKDSILNYASPSFCGKWRVLKRLLQFWHAEGDKVLVFSHSVRLLKMLQMLFASTTSYNVSYLDGAMTYEERARVVANFNSDENQFVFLISTKAGGVGLNITSANKVVVVDPNWNPAYDLQAQDRAYRIGQMRDVDVFRLVSAGTIEEIVYARQIYKQQQANIGYNASLERRYFKGVQDRKEKKGEIFGLKNLFGFQGDGVVLKDIVNKTNVAESRAGVQVVGLEVDATQEDGDNDNILQGDDENAAMSQLAALVAEGGDGLAPGAKKTANTAPKKSDAIQAILAGARVHYTHENSEVIGSSKIEAKLSRNALEQGNDIDMIGKRVFAQSQVEDGAPELDLERDGLEWGSDLENASERIRWKYRPPVDVKKRQFCTMAQTFGFQDATEFALVVEGWTQEQRRNCLDKFYRIRRKKLLGKEEKSEKKDIG